MDLSFLLIALITAASGVAAVSLRKPIHCGLCTALTFLSTGALYLYLKAEYLGLVQLLVYVGAVAVLILFTILLTRPAPRWDVPPPLKRASFWHGALIAMTVTGLIGMAMTGWHPVLVESQATLSIHDLGTELAGNYMRPLLLVGVLLTAALVGAVLLASTDEEEKKEDRP